MTDQPRRGRRAFLCGVSYKEQKHELKGVAQDVKNMKQLLLQQYDFPTESILILAEEESYKLPTRKNMEDAFRWLIKGIQPGDSLVFYYSGHGKRQRDYNRDEIDGFDETICPMDFEKNGMIMDDYINETIVRPLISDVTLHAIIDSCHSGTILDLPHVYDITTGKWEDNNPPSGAYKDTSGGKAICFSACEDYQLAADTSECDRPSERGGINQQYERMLSKESPPCMAKLSSKRSHDKYCETCKSCGHMSYLPPSAQHIRCVRCRTLISVRNTNDMINFPRRRRLKQSFCAIA